jgi:hypothetical protein
MVQTSGSDQSGPLRGQPVEFSRDVVRSDRARIMARTQTQSRSLRNSGAVHRLRRNRGCVPSKHVETPPSRRMWSYLDKHFPLTFGTTVWARSFPPTSSAG